MSLPAGKDDPKAHWSPATPSLASTPAPRLGTFDSRGIRNRLDYIFVTKDLVPRSPAGSVSQGPLGQPHDPSHGMDTFAEITDGNHQASDHAAVFIDLTL